MPESKNNSSLWAGLLCEDRQRSIEPDVERSYARLEGRQELERDYDRVLFATPLRRLADKTQVFPLESHDAIHNRLTHSYEVSALARAVGLDLVARFAPDLGLENDGKTIRDVSALMAAIGLVHDLGNPPFGHQGEAAIRRWFVHNKSHVFDPKYGVCDEDQCDFLLFEGNAQTFRLVTRLQLRGDEAGLNLTAASLAAMLKYTVKSAEADPESEFAAHHKPGFFTSEAALVDRVWEKTGLAPGRRHPFSFLMEACDDIAYSVIDLEDAVRKDLVSYADIADFIRRSTADHAGRTGQLMQEVLDNVNEKMEGARRQETYPFSPAELDELAMQRFRVACISAMVRSTLATFVDRFDAIVNGTFKGDLIASSEASHLRDTLKKLLKKVAFSHRSVLEIELRGSHVLSQLMDKLWQAIVRREDFERADSKRSDPLDAYIYSRISANYRRVFECRSDKTMRYREAQLLTDMVSGMTDSFALSLLEDFRLFTR